MELIDSIKAVLFDLDDTLMQTRNTKVKAIKTLGLRYYNYEIPDELIDKHWETPFFFFF